MIKASLLVTTLLVVSAGATIAQPSFTAATNSPVAGDTYYGHYCDTANISKGAAGANVLWDMTKLIRNDSDTTYYLACTPSCDSFPGANLISSDASAGDTSYFNSGSSGFYLLGNTSGGSLSRFSDSMKVFAYPFSYTNTYKDTAYSFQDLGGGDNIQMYIYSTATYDAWGSLKLPDGVYRNVVRIHRNMIFKDIATFSGFPFADSSEEDNYSYYASGFHNAVVSLDYDTSGTGTSHLTGVTWYTGTGYNPIKAALRAIDQPVNADFSVAPNPAQNDVHFRFTLGSTVAVLSVADVTGRTVGAIPATDLKEGYNDIAFPVAQLTEGIYIVRLQTSNGVQSHKFVVAK